MSEFNSFSEVLTRIYKMDNSITEESLALQILQQSLNLSDPQLRRIYKRIIRGHDLLSTTRRLFRGETKKIADEILQNASSKEQKHIYKRVLSGEDIDYANLPFTGNSLFFIGPTVGMYSQDLEESVMELEKVLTIAADTQINIGQQLEKENIDTEEIVKEFLYKEICLPLSFYIRNKLNVFFWKLKMLFLSADCIGIPDVVEKELRDVEAVLYELKRMISSNIIGSFNLIDSISFPIYSLESKIKNIHLGLEAISTNFNLNTLFYNLSGNVLDHAFNKNITGDEEVSITGKKTKNGYQIIFSDNGKGMTKKQLKNVFIPGKSTKEGNSGIGLSRQKEILESFGGNISVKSKEEEGTTFIIDLPKNMLIED